MNFDKLEVGQTVVVTENTGTWGYRKPFEIVQVTKVTATQFTLSNGKRYMRRHGDEVGGGDYGSYVATVYKGSSVYRYGDRLMTPEEAEKENQEIKAEIRRRKMINVLEDFKWKQLPQEALEAVYKIVKDNTPKPEG